MFVSLSLICVHTSGFKPFIVSLPSLSGQYELMWMCVYERENEK